MTEKIKPVACSVTYCLPSYNSMAACSTIILSRLSNDDISRRTKDGYYEDRYDFVGGLKKFKATVKKSLEWLGSKNHRDFREFRHEIKDLYWIHIPDPDYVASDYAFCMASTDQGQKNVKKHLKALGFTGTKAEYNNKNETRCELFWIPMKTLLKNLEIT